MNQTVIYSLSAAESLSQVLHGVQADRLFVLADENTAVHCLPNINKVSGLKDAKLIVVPAGDQHKTLAQMEQIWLALEEHKATRRSLLVCLGGGMVTDMGGLAASLFKRGIHFVNIPTSLLSMIDASVGGKTAVNFHDLKNEIGLFSMAHSVIISPEFLSTLPPRQLLSGYAEMIKHGLLDGETQWSHLLRPSTIEQFMDSSRQAEDLAPLLETIRLSVAVKERIVSADPTEQGLRKALNLGHTIGHAIESLLLSSSRPAEHGEAVAAGLLAELYLSTVLAGFPQEQLRQTRQFILDHYGRLPLTCNDYPRLVSLMHHDKKNSSDSINFTLLSAIGSPLIDQEVGEDDILEALDFYREG